MLDSLSPSSSPPSSFSPTHPSSPEFSSPPHPASPPPPVDYTDKLYIRNLLLFSALSLHIHTPPLACWDKTACLCSTTCACVLPARDALPKSCADSKMTQHLSDTNLSAGCAAGSRRLELQWQDDDNNNKSTPFK